MRVRSRRRSVSSLVSPGTAGADAAAAGHLAAGLLGQRFAPAAEPGQHVLQLGQLDLGLALAAARVLGEDVQDQRGPVDDLDLHHAFQPAQWLGLSSPSQITVSAPAATTMSASSRALPEPT